MCLYASIPPNKHASSYRNASCHHEDVIVILPRDIQSVSGLPDVDRQALMGLGRSARLQLSGQVVQALQGGRAHKHSFIDVIACTIDKWSASLQT